MNLVLNITVCRVCMKYENGKSLLECEDLQKKFCFVTQLTIETTESLPTLICEKCLQRLKISYEFIKMARDSDANLKEFIAKVGKDFQQVTKTTVKQYEEQEQEEEVDTILLTDSEEVKSPTKKDSFKKQNTRKTKHEIIKDEVEQNAENDEYEENLDSIFLLEDGQLAATTNDSQQDEPLIYEEFINCNKPVDQEVPQEKEHTMPESEYLQDYEPLLEEHNMEYIECNEEDNLQLFEQQEQETSEEIEDQLLETAEEANDSQSQEQVITKSYTFTLNANPVKEKPKKAKRTRKVKTSTGTEGRFVCPQCNHDFSCRQNLNRHMDLHDGNKSFECPECGKPFSQKGSLKQHMFIHTGERPFVCEVCKRGFTQHKSLAFHMRRHTGEKPYKCEQCNSAFRQKDGYKAHLLRHHLVKEQLGDRNTHMCVICKEVLSTDELLKEHMKRHLNNHKDVGTTNVVSTTLTTSVNAEGQECPVFIEFSKEPDEDDLIEKEDNVVDLLAASAHVVDVTNSLASERGRAKKYQCRKCFKGFAILKNLIKHLSIHNSELYQCEKCVLAFETKYALRYHCWKEHQEFHPSLHECEDCQLNFVSEQVLNSHLREIHGLMCPHCPDLEFKTRNALLEHQIDHDEDLKSKISAQ